MIDFRIMNQTSIAVVPSASQAAHYNRIDQFEEDFERELQKWKRRASP
ncbi:hypothetical protein PAT3040_02503 [Paenibacillus agaridevorans]|uniref:Uncharacterized protein n=1 Tax=Paenibacillus agaridevorans TaxID=171404 RepID=A0A2R5ESB4_9BACL|nr:hypothetical protein PAT3040_02503 [Paenibacillus agaridevorans]